MKFLFRIRSVIAMAALFMCLLPACTKEINGNEPQSGPSFTDSVYMVLTAVNKPVNSKTGGYYVALPSNYNTSQSYPLLVYMHGAGQFGNGSSDLPLLLKDGVAQVIHDKKFPGSFTVNGQTTSFIVLMPQVKSFPAAVDIKDCIELARKNWRIDERRIYLSGLSAGSMASCDLAAEMPGSIAALVAMAGVPGDYASSNKCQKMVADNLPVWVFHSEDDPQVNVSAAKGFVAKMASLHPAVPPRLTLWPNGGHDAWTRAVNPSYKEEGLNIYEWMLQYQR